MQAQQATEQAAAPGSKFNPRDPALYVKLHIDESEHKSFGAPVCGLATYYVLNGDPEGCGKRGVELFHLPTLTVFFMPLAEYKKALKDFLPYDVNDVAQRTEGKLKAYAEHNIQHPAQRIRRFIASLTGKPLDEVPQFKDPALTPARAKGEKKGKGVIDHIFESLQEGATKAEILAKLKDAFPARGEEGMKTTINCQLRRLPDARGFVLEQEEVEGRGKVFRAKPK